MNPIQEACQVVLRARRLVRSWGRDVPVMANGLVVETKQRISDMKHELASVHGVEVVAVAPDDLDDDEDEWP